MRHYNEIGERGREPRACPSGWARGRSRPPPVGVAASPCARSESARADSDRAGKFLKTAARAPLSYCWVLWKRQGSHASPAVSQPMKTWLARRSAAWASTVPSRWPSIQRSPTLEPWNAIGTLILRDGSGSPAEAPRESVPSSKNAIQAHAMSVASRERSHASRRTSSGSPPRSSRSSSSRMSALRLRALLPRTRERRRATHRGPAWGAAKRDRRERVSESR